MFQFTGLPSPALWIQAGTHAHYHVWVSPFGNPGIEGWSAPPPGYRSRPRPSSALGAKASTVCPSSLDHEEHLFAAMEFSRYEWNRVFSHGPSKLSSVRTTDVEVDVISRRDRIRTAIELPSRANSLLG